MLTGAPPFANQQKPEVAFCVALEDKRPSRPSNSESLGFTHELWNLLELCWAKDARSRPGVCHVVGCLKRVAEDWSADSTAFLLASDAGIQEVMSMEPEKAQKIADDIDKVRRHASGQNDQNFHLPPRSLTVLGSVGVQSSTSDVYKSCVASGEFYLNHSSLPESWRRLKGNHSTEGVTRMSTKRLTRGRKLL